MILFGLRLLVALLTFAVGVASAWLFNFGLSKNCKTVAVLREGPVVERVFTVGDAPKTRSCSLDRPKSVVQGGILNGKALSKPAPVYPLAAKAAGVAGTVVVRVTLDESGRVQTAEATSGPEMLREAAEEAARKAQFSPTLLSGQPVRVSGDITYNFRLR
ncbi:MAG TPA: energy transducer TonB [Pyrinomonadaceae bacterium]|nr:energy transducer TonB [Pyrinomonadaceae bacterium]